MSSYKGGWGLPEDLRCGHYFAVDYGDLEGESCRFVDFISYSCVDVDMAIICCRFGDFESMGRWRFPQFVSEFSVNISLEKFGQKT